MPNEISLTKNLRYPNRRLGIDVVSYKKNSQALTSSTPVARTQGRTMDILIKFNGWRSNV